MNSSAHTTACLYKENAEPLIEEMLNDPIVRQLMESDRVSPEIIDRLQQQVDALREGLQRLKPQ